MKSQIKNGLIFGLTASITMILAGVVYAAWNDTVSSGDPLTAASWNTLVSKVSELDTNIKISGNNVGIGTSSPQDYGSDYRVLELVGGIPNAGGVFQSSSSNSSVKNRMFVDSAIGFLGTSTNHPLAIQTNGIERMRILNSGNIGIGTQSPNAALQVDGADEVLIVQDDSRSGSSAQAYIAFKDASEVLTGYIGDGSTGTSDLNIYTPNNLEMRADSGYRFNIVGGASAMNINGSGNVTITDLAGTYGGGSAYVCVYDSGTIYASESACP